MHRRGSVPQVFLHTAPPVGGRISPKPSSSISSITITSRKTSCSSTMPDINILQDGDRKPSPMALNNHNTDPDYTNTACLTEVIPQRKALVVKITEQRVETSRFLQPGVKNGPVHCFPLSRTTEENDFSRFSTRRSSDLVEFNPSSVTNHSSVASLSATPVVVRRKATIVKVQEQRETLYRKDMDQRRTVAHRHSFSGLKVTGVKPQLHNECTLSGAVMQVLSSKTKLYRSTMSLQVTSSSGSRLDDSHSSNQTRRPASCYASLFSPNGPSAEGSQDAAVHDIISVLHHKTNIDPAYFAASSSNKCWSTKGGAESHDKIYPKTDSSALDEEQSKRESALSGNQPLSLIKVPGRKPYSVSG